ncbi:tRNA (adenosine(37)-N6)-threonylcarbamoyltransferase complex ATPase subunit type 1 TsaE [Priestia flexa]|jgi:tRNA threonylcarbamoyladenosine biosynthesis protein TsaE|uniref:tRNA threonylcarbamoyladenosine biosynthesis protein TsaE n=2 Tax=Priestia TaxID=2800373 RepID=A0A0V8JG71_9BACI|nr:MULTISPECIES: tRNA (adenosine(37)-N6)-threonylcarbamoyltransferase complex ATPase subunit type 1 TsaE [Priestia]AQX56315.1 tRNA (N6-adenosine(37)-N6)-threonylcarbamoyltransferase complex ATPase TsaE [Priestia flexa]KSU86099.1 tRNA threonylcarbamoyladenosine biosynthesis protein TsaE [Priestia veravalensis]MBN8253951.1 tRNA (adenosine(37)-N6)-threonylcarbamoyltransferase complex ATPase subunit type 1 TsaE [Priestia flexa]MBN8436393.1 tRNA (adenosine(37)-N6)-threonylcarbamoyltransferase comple
MKPLEEFVIQSASIEDTQKLANRLASLLAQGDVLLLEGDLGAGKTTFTKALAKGLEIKRNVNSPTFTIIKEYKDGRLPLYHMDVYRLGDEFEDLGFDEYFEGDGVTVVEWAHLIEEQLPKEFVQINIYHDTPKTRKLVCKAKGARYIDLCKELFNYENISN